MGEEWANGVREVTKRDDRERYRENGHQNSSDELNGGKEVASLTTYK